MVQIHSPRPLLLESATYKMRKSIERPVQGQEVMVQAHSPGAFFPLSNQRVTLRSQIQLQVYFYGQYGQHLWFCLEFRSPAQRFPII
jgi:hypothetical protein